MADEPGTSATGTERAHGGSRAGVRRRTVLAGAVWSLPIVAVAVAAPASAASGGALGRFVIETMQGGTWVDPDYYGASLQLRNDDTQATTLPVADITSGTVTVTIALADAGPLAPVVIANAGGTSPSVPALPDTDPTWTAAGVSDNGDGTVTYTLAYAGSLAGQGVTHVTFGIRGPSPLHSGVSVTVTSTGSPTDGFVHTRTATLF